MIRSSLSSVDGEEAGMTLEGARVPGWVLTVWRNTKGSAWEPPQPNSKGVLWLIENGFAVRVDGRCGYERFKDSMLKWTLAGRLACERALAPEAIPPFSDRFKSDAYCASFAA